MTPALLLLGYAALVATAAPALLLDARWPERLPRTGIAAWQALSASTVAAVVLAGMSSAIPVLPFTVDLAGFLETCVTLLQAQYSSPLGAVAATMGLGLVAAVVLRLAWCTARISVRIARARRLQRDRLALLARHDPARRVLVLDHADVAAYCLPGRGGHVVVTSGALAQLQADQLEAVLAHERAHLRGRHGLVLAAAITLRDAFPFVPLFAAAGQQVPRLVEMAADDVAARSADRACLAHALLNVAGAPAPAGLLGAGGSTAARVRRLAAPGPRLRTVQATVGLAGVAVVLALPLVLAAAPALAATDQSYCWIDHMAA